MRTRDARWPRLRTCDSRSRECRVESSRVSPALPPPTLSTVLKGSKPVSGSPTIFALPCPSLAAPLLLPGSAETDRLRRSGGIVGHIQGGSQSAFCLRLEGDRDGAAGIDRQRGAAGGRLGKGR